MLRNIFMCLIIGLVVTPRSEIVLVIKSQDSNIQVDHIKGSHLKVFFKIPNKTHQLGHISTNLHSPGHKITKSGFYHSCFSENFYEIFQSCYFLEHLRTAASAYC